LKLETRNQKPETVVNLLKIELLPIEEDGYHIFIDAVINGATARLLLDTGASRTVFDEERIKVFLTKNNHRFKRFSKLSTGLGTNTMKSHSIILEEFRLGETVFKDYHAVVLNMEHVNQSYQMLGQKQIDGVLGGDLLQKLKVVVDYRKMEVRWRVKTVSSQR
jgi:predicted aspartyl protease